MAWRKAMSFLYNDKSRKSIRRSLRKRSTVHEQLLWGLLRQFRHSGFIFRRQYSVGVYILDFYCPRTRLCIEVDGSQHQEIRAQQHDQRRDEFLRKLNIRILRVSNYDITTNMEGVIEAIESFLLPPRGLPPSSPPINRRGKGR